METDYEITVPAQGPPSGAERLRTLLLGVLAFGMVGVLAELLLIEHTETRTMWIPVVLIAVGILAVSFRMLSPGRRADRFMAIVMAAFVGSGLLGLWFHVDGNRQFELEIYPSMEGFELAWESLKGATPALAPGTMVLLGLIGLVVTLGASSPHLESTSQESR